MNTKAQIKIIKLKFDIPVENIDTIYSNYEDLDLVIVSNEGVNYDEWYLEEAKKLAKKTFTPVTTPVKNNIDDDPWDDDWWNRTIERQERMQGYAHIYGPSGDIVSSHRIKKKGDKHGKRL